MADAPCQRRNGRHLLSITIFIAFNLQFAYSTSAFGQVLSRAKPTSDSGHNQLGATAGRGPTYPAKELTINVTAFIPPNNLLGPYFATCIDTQQRQQQLYFAGDDRTFNAGFGASCDEFPTCRVRQVVQLAIEEVPDTNRLRVIFTPENMVGLTKAYAPDAIVNGRIREDANDAVGDCHLLHRTARAPTENMEATISIVDQDVKVHLFAGVGNPLVSPSGDISWNLDVTISTRGSETRCIIEGEHKGFPGHEVYINNRLVHNYMPPSYGILTMTRLLNSHDSKGIWGVVPVTRRECLP